MREILPDVYSFPLTNVSIFSNAVNKRTNTRGVDGSVYFPFKRFDSLILNATDCSLSNLRQNYQEFISRTSAALYTVQWLFLSFLYLREAAV